MKLLWTIPLVLSLMRLCFDVTKADNVNTAKPVGPRMCDRLCNKRIGCSSFFYKILDLSCELVTTNDLPRPLSPAQGHYFKLSKNKERQIVERSMACQKGSRIYHSRRNVLRCSKTEFQQRPHRKPARLLILPFSKKTHQVRQLFLHNNSLVDYPFITRRFITAVEYIAATRKVIIAHGKKRSYLAFTPVDDNRTIMVKRNEIFLGMTKDESKQLVFLTTVKPELSIKVMSTQGKNFRLITQLKHAPHGISADCKGNMLYFTIRGGGVLKVSYQGLSQSTVFKGRTHFKIYIDLEKGILYYMIKGKMAWSIIKHGLHTASSSVLPTYLASSEKLNFHVFSNKIYLAHTKTPVSTLTILSTTGRKVKTIDTGYDKKINFVKMCVIL